MLDSRRPRSRAEKAMLSRRLVVVLLGAGIVLTGALLARVGLTLLAARSQPPRSIGKVGPSTPPRSQLTAYVHYYLWWTPKHWQDRLTVGYPAGARSLPVPGSVDGDGCNPEVHFPGATIVDIPSEGLYDQSQANTFDRHIAAANAAGIQGFLVSWQGTGQPAQTPLSSGYDQRLDLLVSRVDAFNAAHGATFRLGLAFASFGDYNRPASSIVNDLAYFASRYGKTEAFTNRFSQKPIVMWLDSRKYSLETLRAVSVAEEPTLYLLGDETAVTWPQDAPYLDGTSYYWSTENPWTNTNAQSSLMRLADEVHLAGKLWFAPFIPGYNKQLLGGVCVPRRGTTTLDRIWSLNSASHPDGWFGISWNEFVENTYLEPTVAYGSTYLDEIRQLIRGSARGSASPTRP